MKCRYYVDFNDVKYWAWWVATVDFMTMDNRQGQFGKDSDTMAFYGDSKWRIFSFSTSAIVNTYRLSIFSLQSVNISKTA